MGHAILFRYAMATRPRRVERIEPHGDAALAAFARALARRSVLRPCAGPEAPPDA